MRLIETILVTAGVLCALSVPLEGGSEAMWWVDFATSKVVAAACGALVYLIERKYHEERGEQHEA